MEKLRHFPQHMEQLLARFSAGNTPVRIAIAVSGGSDSMALLSLCHTYQAQHNITIIALSVDHAIREDSADDCLFVQQFCKLHHIEHHILTNKTPVPTSNLMFYARQRRYDLLTEFCISQGIFILMTAHHHDDQCETFQLMKERGASIHAQAAMMPITHNRAGLVIVRPLLDIPKSALVSYLKERDITWQEDPTNQNRYFLRNDIRMRDQQHPSTHSDMASLALPELQQQRRDLEQSAIAHCMRHLMVLPHGEAILPQHVVKQHDDTSLLRLLRSILMVISGQDSPPRTTKLEHLLHLLRSENTTMTLHGVLITARDTRIYFIREHAAIAPEAQLIEKQILWDGRFTITVPDSLRNQLTISVMQEGERRYIKKILPIPTFFKANLIKTLPILKIDSYSLEKGFIVPHIKESIVGISDQPIRCRFTPKRPLSDMTIFHTDITQ